MPAFVSRLAGLPGVSLLGRASSDEALRLAVGTLLGDPIGWRRASGPTLVSEAAAALTAASPKPDPTIAYLLLACLERRIPTSRAIVDFTREWRAGGLHAPLSAAWAAAAPTSTELVVSSGIVVDATDTGRSRFTTGIQRVARETLTRWARDHDVALVSWNPQGAQLRSTSDAEIVKVILEEASRSRIVRTGDAVVIPFQATFVLPEITVAAKRTENLHTIARFSRSRSTAIGFDCIPVTTSETTGPGMPGAFSKYLAALASFDAIGAISAASAAEYGGWRRMLGGAGLDGPVVATVPLPWQSDDVDPATVARVARELALDDGRDVVLAVGSHEPRKNHLNLLTAAELRWRDGADFHLVMVGGNAWGDEEFQKLVAELRRLGRPLSLLSGVDDEVVWSLYSLARFSVFASINEGFGLPVVESLASGTPVLTSDFGSMRELGEGNGALIVDPHDVRAMSAALARLLDDDSLIARLTDQTRSLERPGWDDYARAVWDLAGADAGSSTSPLA